MSIASRTCAAMCAACIAGVASADVATLGSLKDNTLYQDAAGSLSNGTGPTMFAGLTATSSVRRGLVAFDLSSIPAGATVTDVTLTLFMGQSTTGAMNVALNPVLINWGEGASNAGASGGAGAAAAVGDATWLHAFFNTSPWATAGGDFGGASAVKSVSGVGSYSWNSAGLVADVQSWLDNAGTNFGWAIGGDETVVSSAKRFATREATTPSQRPSLSVTYTVPSPTSLSLLAGGAMVARRRRR